MKKLLIPKLITSSILFYLSNKSTKVTVDIVDGPYVVVPDSELAITLTASENCTVYIYTFNLAHYNKGVNAIELEEGVPYEYEFSSGAAFWIVISDSVI